VGVSLPSELCWSSLLYTTVDHRVLSRCLCGALKHWTACKICDVSVSIMTRL